MDKINPNHYKVGGLEVIDILKAKLTREQYEGFLLGNILKYTFRHQHKNGMEDLQKAQWYFDKLMEINNPLTRAREDWDKLMKGPPIADRALVERLKQHYAKGCMSEYPDNSADV